VIFVGGRIANMVVGMAMIPLLIHSLGGDGFAAWAILLSCAAVFSELQLGMHSALVREVAVADHSEPEAVSRVWSSAAAFLMAIYAAVLPLAALASRPTGEWLRLPEVGSWHPGTAILLVFVCVATRSVLMTGAFALFAAARFRPAAVLSLGQAFVSNVAATLVAWTTRDLAATLVAFWTAQIVIVGAGFAFASGGGWRPRLGRVDVALIRRLINYGVRVQLSEWAQIINFQFDKFVIVRVLGLFPAARYEVANRSVLALRSIPSSGMDTFLPVATRDTLGHDTAPRRMTILAVYGVVLFLAAPLAVSPVFLYAWVGEMGYVSRFVFAYLALGAAANLLALPLAALTQAAGRPEVQARAAAASILLNIPLSLTLVQFWGVDGAALGSSLAMLLGTAVLLKEARRALGPGIVKVVVTTLVRHWPLGAACLAWGVAVHVGFDRWFDAASIHVRYGLDMRARAGGAALALYAGCLLTLVLVRRKMGGLEPEERQFVSRLAAVLRAGGAAPVPGRAPEEPSPPFVP